VLSTLCACPTWANSQSKPCGGECAMQRTWQPKEDCMKLMRLFVFQVLSLSHWDVKLMLGIKKVKKVKWSRYRPGVAQRVGRGIALLFHDCGTRRGWVVSSTPRPHFTPGNDKVPILQEAGWAPGPVWLGGKSRPHRDSIPDRPAHSSVAIPTELPGPQINVRYSVNIRRTINLSSFEYVFGSQQMYKKRI